MSARTKLNLAFFHGALLVSGVIGMGSESWAVFFVVMAALLGGGWYVGDLRPGRTDRPPRGRGRR
jgi:hypothetical protein